MYTVMIVEDELLARIGILSFIPWDHLDIRVVAEVADGATALERFEALRPDIILTDIRMPGMNGLDLIREIRARDKECAIIVISCLEDFGTLHAAMGFGICGYLLKASMSHEDVFKALEQARKSLLGKRVPVSLPEGNDLEAMLCAYLDGHSTDCATLRKRRPDDRWIFHHLIAVHVGGADHPALHSYIEKIIKTKLYAYAEPVVINSRARLIYLIRDDISSHLGDLCDTFKHVIGDVWDSLSIRLRIVLCSLNGPPDDLKPALSVCDRIFADSYLAYDDIICVSKAMALDSAELRDFYHLMERLLLDEEFDAARVATKAGLIDRLRDATVSCRSVFEETLYELALYLSAEVHGFASDQLITLRHTIGGASTLIQAVRLFTRLLELRKAKSNIRSHEVRKAIAFMRDNLMNPISLDDTAHEVNLSPSYFSSIFKRETGRSYTAYLTHMRISVAKKMLEEGHYSIKNIAPKCGYSDIAYFSRVFKQHTGESPSHWSRQ